MKEIIISLVSGILGVILGSITQILYNEKSEKKQRLHDYKKLCITEWLSFRNEVNILLENPRNYNNDIFRLSLEQKNSLLSFLITEENKSYIKKLQQRISDVDERLSLGPYAETALLLGHDEQDKKLLMRDVINLSTEVLKCLTII